jgi:hypothetical protein
MGTVAESGPMPRPRQNLAIKRCHQVFVRPCHKQAVAEVTQLKKMVPRRPRWWFRGTVSQQPISAQQRYGAALEYTVLENGNLTNCWDNLLDKASKPSRPRIFTMDTELFHVKELSTIDHSLI